VEKFLVFFLKKLKPILKNGVEGNCGNFGDHNSFHSLRLYGRERHKRQDLERLGRALYAIRDQECFDG